MNGSYGFDWENHFRRNPRRKMKMHVNFGDESDSQILESTKVNDTITKADTSSQGYSSSLLDDTSNAISDTINALSPKNLSQNLTGIPLWVWIGGAAVLTIVFLPKLINAGTSVANKALPLLLV